MRKAAPLPPAAPVWATQPAAQPQGCANHPGQATRPNRARHRARRRARHRAPSPTCRKRQLMSYTICMWRGSSFSNSATGQRSSASGSTVWLVKAKTCGVVGLGVKGWRVGGWRVGVGGLGVGGWLLLRGWLVEAKTWGFHWGVGLPVGGVGWGVSGGVRLVQDCEFGGLVCVSFGGLVSALLRAPFGKCPNGPPKTSHAKSNKRARQ